MIVSLNCFIAGAAEEWTKAPSVLYQQTVDQNCVAPLYCSILLRGVILRSVVVVL